VTHAILHLSGSFTGRKKCNNTRKISLSVHHAKKTNSELSVSHAFFHIPGFLSGFENFNTTRKISLSVHLAKRRTASYL
jgi:hypothetical protein